MATNMSKVLIFAFIAWIILKPLHKEVHDGDHVFAIIIGERSEPHTYRTVGKNLRHIYIYVFYIYIYIYIYTFVRRARARYAQTSDRPVEVQRSI